MFNNDLIFWNVDTQIDFVEPEGKLYVPGAELLKPGWKEITAFAKQNNIKVVNTADYHYSNSTELSNQPDYISTFPEHCMANTVGADFIAETLPDSPLVFDWNKEYLSFEEVLSVRNIIIHKDAFDVFSGNKYTEDILKILLPKVVVVYGVTTNVCVAAAVAGLAKRVERVIVIEDAIKELANIPLPFESWNQWGVERRTFKNLLAVLSA